MCNAALTNQNILSNAVEERINYESQIRFLSEALSELEVKRLALKDVLPLPSEAAEERLEQVKVCNL